MRGTFTRTLVAGEGGDRQEGDIKIWKTRAQHSLHFGQEPALNGDD